jgi:AcrR family transcriptional regulator
MSDVLAHEIYDALMAGELDAGDLTARRLCRFLGKTTGALYHHYGSLDGLLFEVSQRGYATLRQELERVFARQGDLGDVAEAFVDFGLDHPELYPLMFERRFDWAALRSRGAFERTVESANLLDAVACVLEEAGSTDVAMDGRLLFAGLHGLVSLAASGRANVRALDRSDRDVARDAARALAERILPPKA